MKNLIHFFIFASIVYNVKTANILGIFGCTSHSHHLWNEVIVNGLAERGHTLTIVSVNENKSPRSNVTYIHLEKAYDLINENIIGSLDDVQDLYKPGGLENVLFLYQLKMLSCEGVFQSNGFQDFLNLNEKFDLILYDTETGPCMLRLIERYSSDIPVVGVTAFKMDPRVVEMLGGHSYPGYISHILKKHEMPMNLWKRLENAGTYVFAYLYRKLVCERYIEAMSREYIPGVKASLASLYERIRITLVNTHPSMDYAQSLPPNIVEIGGLHIKQPKPLPNDLKIFLDSSEKGAALISLGTNIKSELLGEKRLEILMNVIKRFPEYNFLWKVEDKGLLKDIPKNLLIQKWLPQNDILAHPKIKLFFTHAGGLSMQEAAFHGKPVVSMPFIVDQINNAYLAEQNGYGRVVAFDDFSENKVYSEFLEIFNNSSYSINMLELQKKFLDRQTKPLDTAIWWIEYFLRNPQANHLSPYSRKMTYFLANSLDIILISYCLISLILFVCIFILCKVIQKVMNSSKSKPKFRHFRLSKLIKFKNN